MKKTKSKSKPKDESEKSSGRPSKNKKRDKGLIQGILDKPIYEDSIFEFSYNYQELLKKVFIEMKRLNNEGKIYLQVKKDGISFFANNNNQNAILIDIMGSRVNSFYMTEEIIYLFNVNNLIRILKNKKTHPENIMFRVSKNDKFLLLVIFDMEGKKIEETWDIAINIMPNIPDVEKFTSISDIEDYAFKVIFDWIYFKNLVSGWKEYNTINVIIDKEKDMPLNFQFQSGEIKSKIKMNDCQKCTTICKSDDLIAKSVPISNLLLVAASDSLSPFLNLCVREDKHILLYANLDEKYEKNSTLIKDSEIGTIKFFIGII